MADDDDRLGDLIARIEDRADYETRDAERALRWVRDELRAIHDQLEAEHVDREARRGLHETLLVAWLEWLAAREQRAIVRELRGACLAERAAEPRDEGSD